MARKSLPYVDRGRPGTIRYNEHGVPVEMQGKVPQVWPERKLALESLRRHNTLDPELQDTHRVFLRWSETAGTGEFNPEAEKRELHYDPLPLEIQQQVTAIVAASCWEKFIRKLYLSTLTRGSLAEQLGISPSQLKNMRNNCLWFFKGRFEMEDIPFLATPKRVRQEWGR